MKNQRPVKMKTRKPISGMDTIFFETLQYDDHREDGPQKYETAINDDVVVCNYYHKQVFNTKFVYPSILHNDDGPSMVSIGYTSPDEKEHWKSQFYHFRGKIVPNHWELKLRAWIWRTFIKD